MDAFEIGLAMAYPEALVPGLEAMGSQFELLDAAAMAAEEDRAVAREAWNFLAPGSAPNGEPVDDVEASEDEEAAPFGLGQVGGGRSRGGGAPVGEQGPGSAGMGDSSGARMTGTVAAAAEMGAERRGGWAAASEPVAPVAAEAMVAPAGMVVVGRDGAETTSTTLVVVEARGGGAIGTARRAPGGGGTRSGPGLGAGSGATPAVRSGRKASGRSAAALFGQGTRARLLEAAGLSGGGLAVTSRVGEARRGGRGDRRDGGEVTFAVTDGRAAAAADADAAPSTWTEEGASAAPAPAGAGGWGNAAGRSSRGGLLADQAVAPADDGGGRDEGSRPVVLDGRLVGQWLSERMARDAARPGAGTTFFDPRQAPAWTPSGAF